jgi:hypothetical protein
MTLMITKWVDGLFSLFNLPTRSTSFFLTQHRTRDSSVRRDDESQRTPRTAGTKKTGFASVPTISVDGDDVGFNRYRIKDSTKTAVSKDADEGSGDRKGKKGELNGGDERTAYERELELDRAMDPTPFQFRPYQLAHILREKDSAAILSLGGTKGILRGLGTDAATGLSAAALVSSSGVAEYYAAVEQGKGFGEINKRKGAKEVVHQNDELGDQGEKQPNGLEGDLQRSMALNGTIDDRRRVYGVNILPARRSKSLLELMWRALKDKILVVLCVAGVISLALGLYKTFDKSLSHGEAPVEWVEGAAILIAVLCVVSKVFVYSLCTFERLHYVFARLLSAPLMTGTRRDNSGPSMTKRKSGA